MFDGTANQGGRHSHLVCVLLVRWGDLDGNRCQMQEFAYGELKTEQCGWPMTKGEKNCGRKGGGRGS